MKDSSMTLLAHSRRPNLRLSGGREHNITVDLNFVFAFALVVVVVFDVDDAISTRLWKMKNRPRPPKATARTFHQQKTFLLQ